MFLTPACLLTKAKNIQELNLNLVPGPQGLLQDLLNALSTLANFDGNCGSKHH